MPLAPPGAAPHLEHPRLVTVLRTLLSLLLTVAVITLSSASLAEGTRTPSSLSALTGPATPSRPAASRPSAAGPTAPAPADAPPAAREADAEDALVEEAVRQVTDRFGPIPVPYEVSLLPRNKFEAVARYWFPEQYEHVDGLSVITGEGVNQVYVRGDAPTASVTVAHELFHLVWCARVDCNAVPLWLTEGAAIAFSEGYAEEVAGGWTPPLPAAPPWWHLPERGFHGIRHAGNPHAVGRQVMARLARSHGPAAVRRFLDLVARDGTDYEEAWRRAFGFPLEDVGTNL